MTDVDTFELSDIWFRSLAYPIEARLEMIRQHYLTQIGSMIAEHGRFKETDFWTVFKTVEKAEDAADNVRDTFVLEITYCYEPSYKFVATMDITDDNATPPRDVQVYVTISPGNMFTTERIGGVWANQLSGHIKDWLKRLDEELSSIPLQRQIEEQHQEIQLIFEQLRDIPKDFISKQEAEGLRARLDELETRLTRNLQETVADQEELETKIKAISDDMSLLKENMNVLNKRSWAKALVTRTFEWAKDPINRKLLKSGVEVAKDLLLPGDPTKPPMS